ncbi:hypothetical protein I350_06392 [Cryptococcus amylolentus CBS 6273]|uniref:C2H2-type domain-containing protein n=1 Tax=Cryptococcus amylolentus CBS 6273 TaxID=1296118 RepID=A0A1E3JNT6_9TREE|nr:hypothetical protein I350_06392 [Cryptococcus amylolentus CBS 6273]
MPSKARKGVRTDGSVLSHTVIHLPIPLTPSRAKFSSNDDPKQTSLKGWITPKPSSAASQPSSNNLTEAPVDRKAKRVATASLEAHGLTAKKSRVGTSTNHPAPDRRPPSASAQNEPDPNDSDDISSDTDDDDDDADSDDGQSGELEDGYARCLKGEEMTSTSFPVAGGDFWMRYLIEPLEKHASRLGLKATPLPEVTRKRLSDVLDLVLGHKSVCFVWTVNPLSKPIRERLLRLWGVFMPTNVQELMGGPEPPSITQLYSLIDANGVCCDERGARLDELEGRGEVQSRCVGVYLKLALPEDDGDEEDGDEEDGDEEDGDEEDAQQREPLAVLVYTGQTAYVRSSGKFMGFRQRWRGHVREVYDAKTVHGQDSRFAKAFMKSRELYRMAFAAMVTVPVPVETEFRNAVKFFSRLSEAVVHEACETIYRARNSSRTRKHRTFWIDGPRDYVGTNAQDPLRESFAFWEVDKPQPLPPKCSYCGKVCSTKGNRDTHEVNVHGPKTFECQHDGCVKRYASEGGLKQHVRRRHTEKSVPCTGEKCDIMFVGIGELNAHVKQVHSEKTVACTIKGCVRMGATKAEIRSHSKLVHGEKTVPCEIAGCKTMWATKGSMKTHVKKVHEPKKVTELVKTLMEITEEAGPRGKSFCV